MKIPEFVTHYHLADRQPFLNLSDLSETDLEEVRQGLQKLRRARGHKRPFGRKYIEMRRLTEERLRRLFVARGGRPERSAPHYFILGKCEWFKQLAPDTKEVVVPLGDLPAPVTSFTYLDSFEAMGFGADFGVPRQDARPYNDRVYLIDELEAVIGEYGMPKVEHDSYWEAPVERFVEVQLWADEPVRHLLRPST